MGQSTDLFAMNRRIWLVLAVLAAVTAVWMAAEDMTLDISGAKIFIYIYIGFFALAFIYRRRDKNVYILAHAANQWLSAAAILGVLSYVSARLNFPLNDDTLIAIDRALFFEWKDYVAWADRHALIARAFSLAYISAGPQIMAAVVILFLCRQLGQLQRFLLAFIITGFITVILSALYPGVAGYVHYDIDVSQYQNLRPIAARIHEEPYFAMRNHSVDVLTFPMQGIVTFPSFHAALAILLIYAAWPVRWLRRIALPLNILVCIATPVDGGHWLTDVLGGIAIALLVIYAVERRFGTTATPPARNS